MNKYELTLLVAEESELNTVKDSIITFKGKITKEEKWGKRTLAYPIKKKTSAYYFFFEFEIDRKDLLELKKALNFNEKIIRYLILNID